ncbi:MAG: response regulator [Pirellulaceae bacterium]
MAEGKPSYDELKQRLDEAEGVISILRDGQVDAVVGKDSVVLLRLAEAEKRLRRNQVRLQAALEASGGAVYERAVPPDDSTYISDRWAAMLGYDSGEIPGKNQFLDWFFEQVHPEDREQVQQAYCDFVAGKTEHYNVELRLRHKQGHWLWVHDISRAIEYNDQGCISRLVGVVSDTTAYKQTEEELKASRAAALNVMEDAIEARRQTEEAEEKLRTLNETLEQQVAERTTLAERRAQDLRRLAAELSEAEHRERKRLARVLHDDLQQLLLAVKLRLPVLLEGDQSQLAGYVERLDELVGECLSTSRNLSHELSPSVLQQGCLTEVMGWLSEWFGDKHHLTVAVDAPKDLPAVPEHIRVFIFQAVRELLSNVVKHSGSMQARIVLTFEAGSLGVRVEDGGDGFDPAAVEACLERPRGFGLFNIRERLEALGGRLEIRATPEGGASFPLLLPVAEVTESGSREAAEAPVEISFTDADKPRGASDLVRLLVVDDHAVVRDGFVGLLDAQPDFQVVGEAANGEEARRQADALQPTAIIMDVDMPTMSGVDATRRIKQRQPETVIVGLSLHEDEAMIRAMTEAGADIHLSKHAPTKELVDTIRGMCSTHQ